MLASLRREIRSIVRKVMDRAVVGGASSGGPAVTSPFCSSLPIVPVIVAGRAGYEASTIFCASSSPSKRLDVSRNNFAVSESRKTSPVFVSDGRTTPPDSFDR